MIERTKKDLIISNEVHSQLFLVKGILQKKTGKNITLNDVVSFLFSYWQTGRRNPVELNLDYNHEEMKQAIKEGRDFFKLEEKE